jgi:cytochrome b subunit of formate dehydrogenase
MIFLFLFLSGTSTEGDLVLLHDKFSESPPELRQQRLDYIDKRWKQLAEATVARLDAAVTFLMLTNSGGALATLSFMGAMKTISPLPGASWMLALFLLGVVFVGILRTIHYYRMAWLFSGWRDDVANAMKDQLSWSELLARDNHRAKYFVVADIVGWLAFSCFIAGTAIGYVGMFKLGVTP